MQIGGEKVHGVKWPGKREVPALKTKDEQMSTPNAKPYVRHGFIQNIVDKEKHV